ncbi:VCBS domain-containing protein [Bradyrhizobium sp. RDT46]|uniref:VCBS domain-containing protein n=1 Tax=Bradyrhizobium sp. RDT46 TaxID=3341829 RepID=UPI0035C67C2C
MNYAGQFDGAISLDGKGSHSPGNAHVDSFTAKAHGHVPEGAFVVPDPNLIFNGEFKRTGLDLVLSHEGHEFVVHDYFRGDKRAALASPDGAHLTGEIVSALTGYVQVAQAAPGAAAAQVIGHVTKLVGSATAIRNGVSVILNNGDNVEKGDVVSTGSDSTLGITFIDGTVFGLSSNARMVLNEMVYDPNGSSNSSLLSLVAGTITFVAGETAKHGDMKIDTPVATMGIRGTAVLTQINFVVPAGGGDPQPQASFQVLVEPNGTTGSYILFDKVTLLPIATVNQAGQMIQISGGNVSITNALMSPDVQKLITDVFTLKFSDNNTNTKLTTNFTDTLTPMSLDVVFKSSSGPIAIATFVNLNPQGQEGPSTSPPPIVRIPGQPIAQSFDASGNVKTAFALIERAGATGATDADTISGLIRFVDQNLGDRPTVSISLAEAPNYVYKDAGQHDVTGSLTALQKQAIAATQIQISVAPDPGNNNNGSAVWTYTIPDHVFDFLAAGETVTLTYMVRVDTNFAVSPESKFIPIAITITGTNDKPVITTDVPIITFEGGTSVPGGPLTSEVPTSGTLNFNDVDLTDNHTVSVALTSATLPDGSVPPGPLAAFQSAMSVAIAAGADSTGDGTGTINWSLADLPVYLADFIPQGAVLTLVYTVTLTDSQGGASQQTITVTITGTDAPAVVWIATEKPGAPSGGFWKDAANWATGTVPTSNDDVIVITDQLHGLTPSYPVTIDTAAYAKSLTLDDYDTAPGHKVPEVINNSTLTIEGKLTLNADAKFTNSLGGHVTVKGAIDVETITRTSGVVVTNTSTITNAGTLTLRAGGTIDTLTAIANSGMIDLTGGTLVLKSDVANTGGTVQVEAGATLVVEDTTVDGGSVAILGTLELDGTSLIENGTLNNSGTVNVNGTVEFANQTVSNTSGGTIKVLANGWLTIDQGSSVANAGHVTVDASGKLSISGATISGGTIDGGGTIDVTGASKIDGGAILSTSAVSVESGVTLTLGDVTVAGTAIANGGTVKVDASKKLTLSGASLTGGTLTVVGTLDAIGISTVTDASITNNGLIEAIGGGLTLAATTSAAVANAGTLGPMAPSLELDHQDVTNTGTLSAINDGTLKLTALAVTNTGGIVSVASGSTLDLSGATIDDGTVTIAGTLESTGTSAVQGADLNNTGTVTVTSGTLTIDPGLLHAITNQGLIEAVAGGTLKLTTAIIANAGGTIAVDGASKLYLTDVSINGGSLSNAGNLYSVSGSNTITGAVTNTGTIEVQAGTLNLSGGITGIGTLIVDDGATLALGGADAQTVTFAGGVNTLRLDATSHDFTGTITAEASTGGTFTVTGDADITSASGDALVLTASGGTSNDHGDVILMPTGALTGAANGIVVTQNGVGDISLTATKDITGNAGNGITLRHSATGSGDITLNNLTGKATGTGANSVGVLVENLNVANSGGISITQLGGAVGGAYGIDAVTLGNGDVEIDAGGAITGSSIYGIRSRSYGSGSQTVTTEAGSTITSGSSGIVAVNRATSIGGAAESGITITAYGSINSGSSPNLAGNAPAGIEAGYTGATNGTSANTLVNATVIVNNHASITAAAGYGINAFNYGNGDVTVNSFAGTTISVSGSQGVGINAAALSGGAGDVTVTLGENVTISGATSYGIRAFSLNAGDISVTLATGDSITSGSSGIVAVNYATAIAAGVGSTISVEAHGTIHSGATLNNDGTTPGGIIAGYKPGGNGTFSNAVNGDVIVTSDATITADAGYGIEAFTWGAGDVTVTTGQNSDINAAGIAIGAFDHGGGDVSVTNNGSATGSVGVAALATGGGDITIVNHGSITSTSLAGISVTQNGTGATGSTHITNSGSIAAPTGHAAIYIQENATGTATIDNTGTIGPDDAGTVTSTTYAIVETGGPITINNAGDINGNISVATATFNNQAGGTWTVSGTSVFGNASSIVNAGDIDLLNGAWIAGNGLTIVNAHEIDSWGTAKISGAITNTGTIEVNDGTLTLFGSLSGTGSATVHDGALLKLEGSVTQTITLAGDGAALQIDTATFGGSIAQLSANDTIDLSTIKYGVGTSAVYVANADPSTGGVLTVTDADGNHISLNLTGADYSNGHFAGSSDGHGGTLITFNANDDAPALDTSTASLTASFSELENTTGSAASNPAPAATGSIDFTDIDLTDRPTAEITDQSVTTNDPSLVLTPDQETALKQALEIATTGKNNGTVTWSYSTADSALDFLGEGQTATVVSTIELDDHQGQSDTAEVTITITGRNDAPTLAGAQLGAVSEDAVAPAGSSVGALFAAGFHDADAGASFKGVVITASHATAAEGVWQYEVAGGDQWIDISGVSNTAALVLATDTLIRFVPAADYSGVPGGLDVHALDDTYGGEVTTPILIDITSPAIGSSVSAQATTLGTEVTPVADTPVFNIDHTPIADAGEFLVNTTTANDQTYSAVGALSDGGYVIAWVSQGQDGDGTGIYAQRYDSSGARVDGEFRVNTATAGDQSGPYVVGLEGGGFVVSWTCGSNNQAAIHLQRYDASGSPAGGEISLSGYGENATLAALSSGGFVITYVSSDSSTSGTYGIVYDAGGTATSGPFLINTTTASQQQGDSVAGTADGGFVASWHSYGQDAPDSWGVYFQRFDAQGNKLGGEVQVNTTIAGDQYGGELTVLKDGSIVVSYTDANTMMLRHFSSTGAPIGNEVSVSDATTATLQALPDGGFLVTYQGHDAPGSLGLLGQRFDASLHAVGSSFVINEITTGDQLFLADRSNPTAVTSDGKIVATWFSSGDGGNDVEARVFAMPGFGSDSPIKLPAITAAAVDSDGSETLLIKLSGYPAGATFSVGHAGSGADAGQWLIGATEIASLANSGLTMTAPAGYRGEFNLHVGVTVIDSANGLSGQLTDTYTITEDVVVKAGGGPVIDTSGFQVEHIIENGNDIITDLVVIDTDSGAAANTFTVTLSTAHPDVSTASVYPTTGTLEQINTGLATGAGIVYDPVGASSDEIPEPPATDQITLTVADSVGHYDTVNFIFVEGADGQGITLQGTAGKDVIFATEQSDTLIGGGAKDQFVFAPTSSQPAVQHTVNDFETGLDKIDLRQFSSITSWTQVSSLAEQQGADTLLNLDGNDKILLKNVVADNLHASDFILHVS